MYSQLASYCQMGTSDVREILKEHEWSEKYEKGEVDSRFLFHQLPPQIQGSKGFLGWMDAISNIFKANDPLNTLTKELKQASLKLFTLSNICEAHFGYAYTHFPVLHHFDGHILSYEVQARAPDEKIYKEALKQSAAVKERCFYITASEECVAKAKSLSIDSWLYTTPEELRLQLIQKNLILQ